jgi:hypothetical protein
MKKIIITGFPRTGTTALANILNHSSKILITNESGLFDNNPLNYEVRKDSFLKNNRANNEFLNRKNLTMDDVDNFCNGNFEKKGDIEFIGDKFPTYCTSQDYCRHFVNNHQDAYFIFTYRNPCATLYSGYNRGKFEERITADWYFHDAQSSSQKFNYYNGNWAEFIYPRVKNKIIINYDYYINNIDLLLKDLSRFLDVDLNIETFSQKPAILLNSDVGFEEKRSLYSNNKLDEYKKGFPQEIIDFINNETSMLDNHIRGLFEELLEKND